jgi:hypothetical protein
VALLPHTRGGWGPARDSAGPVFPVGLAAGFGRPREKCEDSALEVFDSGPNHGDGSSPTGLRGSLLRTGCSVDELVHMTTKLSY